MRHDAISRFTDAMTAAGLPCTDAIKTDEGIVRYHVDGDSSGSKNGWYVFYGGDVAAGRFGSWKTDQSVAWYEKREQTLSPAEKSRYKTQMAEAKAKADESRALDRAVARKNAANIWEKAKPAPADHTYLATKAVKPHGLRIHDDGRLVVPMRDADGLLHTLQYISNDGEKKFLYGGDPKGHYFSTGKPDQRVHICEGFATGATTHEVTGDAVVIAFTAENLLPVAEAIRAELPDIDIVIASDNDQYEPVNTGVVKSSDAARAVGGKVAIPKFVNTESKPTDFNDLFVLEGAEIVGSQLSNVIDVGQQTVADISQVTGIPSDELRDQAVTWLSKLNPMDYDAMRTSEAKRLGVRAKTLDATVEQLRGDGDGENHKGQGSWFKFQTFEPWESEVDGAELLDELAGLFTKYVVLPGHAANALALWVMHTYTLDAAYVSPLLDISSPQKRCGKSTLLSVLSQLVNKAILASNISPSALFRTLEAVQPTLLIDEADTFLKTSDELRGILNAGHSRTAAYVIRTVGDDNEPRQFSTWGAKALAMIGRPPETIADRAIRILLRRKLTGEQAERLRLNGRAAFPETQRKCVRWAEDNINELKSIDVDDIAELNDRAQDNWRALLAVAKLAGGEWMARAIETATALSSDDEGDEAIEAMLLADIKNMFGERDRLSSEYLTAELVKMEERPWPEWRQGKPISTRQVAGKLKAFDIKPRQMKLDGKNVRGYELEWFDDAFARYLPNLSATPLQRSADAALQDFASATPNAEVADRDHPKPAPPLGCSGVADRNPEEPPFAHVHAETDDSDGKVEYEF